MNQNIIGPTQVDHLLSGNAVRAIISRRRPNLTLWDNEKIARICRIHKAIHIQRQSLVRASLFGRNAGQHAVQFGMGNQLWTLAHRKATDMRHGGQMDRAWEGRAQMFHNV